MAPQRRRALPSRPLLPGCCGTGKTPSAPPTRRHEESGGKGGPTDARLRPRGRTRGPQIRPRGWRGRTPTGPGLGMRRRDGEGSWVPGPHPQARTVSWRTLGRASHVTWPRPGTRRSSRRVRALPPGHMSATMRSSSGAVKTQERRSCAVATAGVLPLVDGHKKPPFSRLPKTRQRPIFASRNANIGTN